MVKSTRHSFLDRKAHCLFEPRKLHAIAKSAIGLPTEEAFKKIVTTLAQEYPGYIETQPRWVFNIAGGAMGQMTLLHGSLREYLILFGTCSGTSGHSGRYKAEVYDFMFKGEMICEYEGVFKREIHLPGSPAYLPIGRVKHYWIKEEGWMLEYSRGTIVSMLPFGLMDNLSSTLDHMTIFRTIYRYGRLVVRNLFKKGKDLDLIFKFMFKLFGFLGIFFMLIWGISQFAALI
jgi:hypothetical protein